MTKASTPIESRVSMVSRSDSPLETDEPFAETLMVSADSHLPAISNEVRVRVESSKKMFTTVRPRRAGSFFTGRDCTCCISSATSRIDVADARSRSAALSRCLIGCPPSFRW